MGRNSFNGTVFSFYSSGFNSKQTLGKLIAPGAYRADSTILRKLKIK